MPMISDFKQALSVGKPEVVTNEVSNGNTTLDVKNNNMDFADFMHRKLQDLDLMLMKDKGATTITKIVLHFEEKIKGEYFFLN